MTDSGLVMTARAGDTFDSVSLALFGDEKYAAELMTANPALVRQGVFYGGEVIKIPAIERPRKGKYSPAKAPWK